MAASRDAQLIPDADPVKRFAQPADIRQRRVIQPHRDGDHFHISIQIRLPERREQVFKDHPRRHTASTENAKPSEERRIAKARIACVTCAGGEPAR